MKKLFFAVLGITALSAVATTGLSLNSTAQAQKKGAAPVIITISTDQVIAQSKAGKAAVEDVNKYRQSIATELQAEATKFESDVKSFQQNSELWSVEERQKKQRELQLKQQQLPGMQNAMENILNQSIQKVRFDILKEAEPIMLDIAKKRNATVMLDRSAILYAAEETNITQEVISKLDKKLKNVTVEQLSLADVKRISEENFKKQQAAAQQ